MSARGLALAALGRWRTSAIFADAILAQLLQASSLAPPDRALATELFYGILRNLTLLDFWIDTLRPTHLDHTSRDLLRLGFYQLFLLKISEHAAVYETVALAGRKSRALVNAILRSAQRRQTELLTATENQTLSVRTSHPQFLIDRWTRTFGAENATALCEWNNRPPQTYARHNRLKVAAPGLDDFVPLTSIPTDALARGELYIQDPSTTTAGDLLDPQPGDKVLDACAAPGGKTGHLAELMENRGVIVACDRNPNRLHILRENLDRLGVAIARVVQHDWSSGAVPAEILSFAPFDRILLDAPCSNTGVMRRRIDLRWRLRPRDFQRMPAEQLRIWRAVAPLLKAGGTLVYSTCSIEPEENREVVAAGVREFPNLTATEQISLLPFRDHTDGAYAAKLIRAE
ncbi:MAG: transcription antitermination factor NusB [Verrucomicrobiota bacterium]